MMVLSRWSPALLILGGALMTVLIVALAMDPASPALYGFLLVAPVIGIGAFGALVGDRDGADRGTGLLGRVSALLALLGGVSVALLGTYAVATGQFLLNASVGEGDPLTGPFMVTSMAWMLGAFGVALAMIRSRAVPPLGGWLVLVGTASAIVVGTILASVAPALSALSPAPFGLGWVVVGWQMRDARPATPTQPGAAGRASISR